MEAKDQEKIKIIKQYLGRAFTASSYHTYGNIPRSKFEKACREYAGFVSYDECIGMTDETVFGSGSRGFLFTLEGFYYNGCSGISYYRDGYSFNSLGSLYNLSVFNEMLDKLYEIETKKGVLDSLLDFAGSVAEAYVEEKSNEYAQKQKRKEREENEEFLDVMEGIKEFLKVLDKQVVSLMHFEGSDFSDYCDSIVRLAAFLSHDRDLYDDLSSDYLSEEEEEDFEAFYESVKMISDMLLEEDEEYEGIDLKKSIRAFRTSVIDFFDDLEDAEDQDEYEELIEEIQKSLEKLHSKFKASIKRVKLIIEMALED